MMDNNHTENSREQAVKTFCDYNKPDEVSTNLLAWEERIERWGAVLLASIIIFGVIDTIAIGITEYQKLLIVENAEVAKEGMVGPVLSSMYDYFIVAFIEYCVYKVIALLLGAVSKIVQNTTIVANLALLNANKRTGTLVNNQDAHKSDKTGFSKNKEYQDNKSSKESGINFKCPNCGEELFFSENVQSATCPWCDYIFKINQ